MFKKFKLEPNYREELGGFKESFTLYQRTFGFQYGHCFPTLYWAYVTEGQKESLERLIKKLKKDNGVSYY